MTRYTFVSRYILLFLFHLVFVGCNSNTAMNESTINQENTEQQLAFEQLKLKADSAKLFSKQKGFDENYCILIDFSIHSGKNRFFVWDFKNDTIKYQGLCCHGYGQKSTQSKPIFSNIKGSYCSSLGRYKVGIRSYSRWGINVHYKLHGLDKTNSNAFDRIIVLHSFDPISDEEIYPSHLPLGYSQGCPVISNDLMRKMDALLKQVKKPILLWIYN